MDVGVRGRRAWGARCSLLTVLAALALVLTACAGSQPPQARVPGSSPGGPAPRTGPARRPVPTIEFVGASVTAGWYSSGVHHAYPAVVVGALRKGRVHLQSEVRAVPGATVQDSLQWDIHKRVNIVVVQMGSNNFANSTPLTVFAPLYQQLITTLRQASPKADLVCLGQWHESGIDDMNGNTPEDFDDVMRSACEGAGGTFEPLEQVYDVASNHGPLGSRTPFGRRDLLHPNDAGDASIARVVRQGIKKQPPLASTFPSHR